MNVPSYDVIRAQDATLAFCRDVAPRLPVNIARHLQENVIGFYPKSDPVKIVGKMKKDVIAPLEGRGLLVQYTPQHTEVWGAARRATTLRCKNFNLLVPRNARELYHTHFLYLADNTTFPNIHSLPAVPKEMNFMVITMLHKFKKPKNFTWEMLNLLLCSADKRVRDQLRIYLYSLPLDYNEIEWLERVLDYGSHYTDHEFPMKPSEEGAKFFLKQISENKKA